MRLRSVPRRCNNPRPVQPPSDSSRPPAADWLQPPEEQVGLTRYLQTLRERIWIVVIAVVVTTGIAILYVATATKMYQGEASVLVTPVSSDNPVYQGLPVIQQSPDPTRDVETASELVTTVDVADRVVKKLDLSKSPRDLLDNVQAQPVAQSNIIAVTAKWDSPDGARDIANAFATEAIKEQTSQIYAAIDAALPTIKPGADQADPSTISDPNSQLALASGLEAIRKKPNPTQLAVTTKADTPTTPVSPRPVLSVAAAIVAGLVLGISAAFAAQALDPRLRREEQLRRLYRLPVLARIPREAAKRRPLSPLELSPAALEAYRTLRTTLAVSRGRATTDARVILVTGSSPSEGKTTTAVSLATSLAAAGSSVILIESDLRRPSIAGPLGVSPEHGIVSVLIENVDLQDALVTTTAYGSNLGMLLAEYQGGWITELFALPAAQRMIAEAREIADYVVIDSPPLTDVIDALPLVAYADDVLLVVKLGVTRLDRLSQLGELLAENGVKPAGFAVVGTARPRRGEYRYYAGRAQRVTGSGGERKTVGPGAGVE
jgi:capsular exopolysaccharide synthesis family protein